jgi:magnesium transporter
MVRGLKKRSKKAGLPPGTLVHVGEKKTDMVRITVLDYDEQNFSERTISAVEECQQFRTTPSVTWINVDGVHRLDIVEKIGQEFGLHPLILEDIVNTGQRPKVEDFGEYMFIVLKMLTYDPKEKAVDSEQVSLVVGQNFVISFQEKSGDVFEHIRERIRTAKGRIRKMVSDYLAYSLMDAIVDHYFLILERLGETIESMAEEVISEPGQKMIQDIHRHKKELILLRRSIWPLREVISSLQRSESSLIKESTVIYLRDVYDHTIQVIDTIESFRDTVSGMVEVYLSSISNRMNAVMKVLTIIATIFIPLTFIAGIYGMNFKHMPELEWPWAYPVGFWLIIVIVVSVMLVYFRRKKWL